LQSFEVTCAEEDLVEEFQNQNVKVGSSEYRLANCGICLSKTSEEPRFYCPEKHVFCKKCLEDYEEEKPNFDCPFCRKKYAGYELNRLGNLAESNVGLVTQRTIEALLWLFAIKFTSTMNWYLYPDSLDLKSSFDRSLNIVVMFPVCLVIHLAFLIPLLNRIRNKTFDEDSVHSIPIGVILYIFLNIFCKYLFIFFL
jgi:hypothetical protein